MALYLLWQQQRRCVVSPILGRPTEWAQVQLRMEWDLHSFSLTWPHGLLVVILLHWILTWKIQLAFVGGFLWPAGFLHTSSNNSFLWRACPLTDFPIQFHSSGKAEIEILYSPYKSSNIDGTLENIVYCKSETPVTLRHPLKSFNIWFLWTDPTIPETTWFKLPM